MSCTHENVRSFEFSDGQVIRCCADQECTAFDTHRRAVLSGKQHSKYSETLEENQDDNEEKIEEDLNGAQSQCGVATEQS